MSEKNESVLMSNEEMEKVTGGMSAAAAPRRKPGREGSFTSLEEAMAKPKEDITWEDFQDTWHWLVKGDHYIG